VKYPRLHPTGGARGPLKPAGWDRIKIAADVLPGMAEVTKGGLAFRIDEKLPVGANGSKPTYQGPKREEIEVTVTVWTDEQLAELDRIVRGIVDHVGEHPEEAALAFDAPQVRHLGVSLVVVKSIGILKPSTKHTNAMEMQITFLPWVPPAPATAAKFTGTPKRAIRNKRREDAAQRANPSPAQQGGAASPTGADPPTQYREAGKKF
jgi:hypothetical protein